MRHPLLVGFGPLLATLVLFTAGCDGNGRRIAGLRPIPTPPSPPTSPGPGLEVTSLPSSTPAYEPIPLVVTVRDANGNPIAGASVTVALETNPGAMIFWAGGRDDHFQLVDPVSATNADFIGVASGGNAEPAAVYDPAQGLVLIYDSSDNFGTVDPVRGTYTQLGANTHTGNDEPRQMAFDPTGRLFLVDSDDDRLFEVDKTDGTQVVLGTMTNLRSETTALATDPTTGTMYVGGYNDIGSQRGLLAVDLVSLATTFVGDFSPSPLDVWVNGLTFFPNGDLYASTGPEGDNEYECFAVDRTTGALGAGLVPVGPSVNDGCSLCTVPARLRGTLTVTSDANGVATFTDLIIDGVASGYTFRISAPGVAAIESGSFAVTAPDLSGVVEFATGASSASEGSGRVAIQINVTPPQNHPIVFYFALQGSVDIPSEAPISSSSDFDMPQVGNVGEESQTAVVIPPSTASFSLLVDIIDDSVTEGDETLDILIGSRNYPNKVGLGTAGATTVHTLTIVDNDP